jgi:hypothetical protein
VSSSQNSSISGAAGSSSQPTRFPAPLDSATAPLEDRTQAELAALARTFSKGLAFWHLSDQLDPNEAWPKFLPDLSSPVQAEALAATCPQKALFLAFLQMYEEARKELNGVTARHLEFYYREVLGLAPRGPVPDQAHIVASLKKTAAELLVPGGTAFKTKDGLEYAQKSKWWRTAPNSRIEGSLRLTPGLGGCAMQWKRLRRTVSASLSPRRIPRGIRSGTATRFRTPRWDLLFHRPFC